MNLAFVPLLNSAAILVIIILLYVLLLQMRESIRSISRSKMPDLSDLEQAVRELKALSQERVVDNDLRQTRQDLASALSVQDRLQLARLVTLMNVLDDKVTTAATHAVGVAEDLAKSHERANEAEGPSGAAADAASKTA